MQNTWETQETRVVLKAGKGVGDSNKPRICTQLHDLAEYKQLITS